MAYEKTTWVDGETEIDAQKLNKIEQGIVEAGQVVDTFNVEDKITNAPSVRAVEEAIEIEKLVVSDVLTLNEGFSFTNSGNNLYRQGKRIFGNICIIKSEAFTANQNTTLGTLTLKPSILTFNHSVSSNSIWDIGALSYLVLEIGGGMVCKVSSSSHNQIKCYIDYVTS